MAKNTAQQNEVIDYFDSALLYVYAKSWQNRQNDDLIKLDQLARQVTKAIESWPIAMDDDQRSKMYFEVMDGLRAINKIKTKRLPYKDRIYWTTNNPLGVNLPQLHIRHYDKLLDISIALNNLAYEMVDVSDEICELWQVKASMQKYACCLADRYELPINYGMLASIIERHVYHVNHVDTYGTLDEQAELLNRIKTYIKKSERDFEKFKRMILRRRLIDQLEPEAKKLDIKIDQHYCWGLLPRVELTPLKLLKLYQKMNFQRELSDVKFNPEQVLPEQPTDLSFNKLKELQSFFMAKPTPATDFKNYILNTDRDDVRIHGYKEQGSLALCIPYNTPADKAIVLIDQFKRQVRQSILDNLDETGDITKTNKAKVDFSVWNVPYKRAIITNKGSILGLLAGLLCDHIFLYWKGETLPNTGQKITSVEDAICAAVEILKQHGFTYDAETVPKSRTTARKKIRDIPHILSFA